MKKITKVLFGTVVALMSIAVLGACGNKTNSKSEDAGSDKITLSMGWWGSQVRHDATVKVIKMYEKKHPNVKIDYEFYDQDGYFTKLNTLQASKSVWDVFQMGNGYQAYLDSIEPLNKYIKDGTIDTSNMSKMYLNTTALNGKQLGISNGVGAYAIAYDPELFKKAGLDEPKSDWTWKEFEKDCTVIHDKLNIYGFSNFTDFFANVDGVLPGYGKNFFDPKTNSASLGFKNYKLLTPYFEMRKKLVAEGAYPDSGKITEIKDIEGDYLVSKEAAMTWIASNQISALTEAAKRPLKLISIPRQDKDVPSTGLQSSQMMSVAKNSKHKKEAAKFISFFENNIAANKILKAERGVPVSSKVRDSLKADSDDATKTLFNYVDDIGKNGNKNLNTVESARSAVIEDQYKLYMQDVVAGKMTPNQAAKKIYTFAKDKLAE